MLALGEELCEIGGLVAPKNGNGAEMTEMDVVVG